MKQIIRNTIFIILGVFTCSLVYKSESNTLCGLSLNKKKTLKCEKCNTIFVKDIDLNFDKLDTSMVLNFLCTIDSSCINKVEFCQYSNEILFKLLERKTELIIEILANYDLDIKTIGNMLNHPINDIIDIDKIKMLVKRKSSNTSIRNFIITSLPADY